MQKHAKLEQKWKKVKNHGIRRNSRLFDEVVYWIGSDTGLSWAETSDSRLESWSSRLD